MMATMAKMLSQLAMYETMSQLSAQMVEAAHAQDWDTLVELENQVSALRDCLIARNEDIAAYPSQVNQKRQLIQSILANDAEVRRHTEPWMEHLRQYLGDNARRRNVERAYSVSF